MFIDYQSLVFEDYQKKKAENSVSPRLINPTPAKIKEECMAVCEERYRNKDEETLRIFFGKRENVAAYIQAIKKHDTDKFKPLVNYLRGQVLNTEEKNVELLAWLINFEPRPFKLGGVYNSTGPKQEVGEPEVRQQEVGEQEEPEAEEGMYTAEAIEAVNEPETVEVINDPNETPGIPLTLSQIPKNPASRLKIRSIIILSLTLISLSAGGYWLLIRKPPKPLTGKEKCMYWAGDHYQQVSCNQNLGDTLVVALDTVKLRDFKKITAPDTLTGYSKGSVWYVKIDEKIEFYTSDGYHPIYHQKRLKPLTDYILYKYVHRN